MLKKIKHRIQDKPVWVTRKGVRFYSWRDVEDTHLLNIVAMLRRSLSETDPNRGPLFSRDALLSYVTDFDRISKILVEPLKEIERRGLSDPGISPVRPFRDIAIHYPVEKPPFEFDPVANHYVQCVARNIREKNDWCGKTTMKGSNFCVECECSVPGCSNGWSESWPLVPGYPKLCGYHCDHPPDEFKDLIYVSRLSSDAEWYAMMR